MIKFDFFNDTDPGNDGVVIEYYSNAAQDWKPLGEVNRGINWYNYSVIAGRPGIQDLAPKGWSGRNNAWMDARYKLDDFEAYEDFRFRIAFGAVGVGNPNPEGFAFDNVWIGNRTRNVLLEHFSNQGDESNAPATFDDMNQYVYDLIYTTALVEDVVLIQYNVGSPISDKFYLDNPADPSARQSFYGTSSGKAIIDGSSAPSNGGASMSLTQLDFEEDMLESPKFDVEFVSSSISNGMVEAYIKVTANEDMPATDYGLRIAVVEDSMTYASGEAVHSLVRKMMDDARGKEYLNHAWTAQQSDTMRRTWPFDPTKYNEQNMSIVAFMQRGTQNSNNQKVFQAISTRDISVFTPGPGVGNTQVEEAKTDAEILRNMTLFPNPARDIVNIQFDTPLAQDIAWQVVDLQGRVLREGAMYEGEQKMSFLSQDWPSGMYVFVIKDPRFKIYRKFIISGH